MPCSPLFTLKKISRNVWPCGARHHTSHHTSAIIVSCFARSRSESTWFPASSLTTLKSLVSVPSKFPRRRLMPLPTPVLFRFKELPRRSAERRWGVGARETKRRTRGHAETGHSRKHKHGCELVTHAELEHTQVLTHTQCTHTHNARTQGDTQTQIQLQAQARAHAHTH